MATFVPTPRPSPSEKPLKTKALDDDIQDKTPKRVISPIYAPKCAILCHFVKKLYTSTINLFSFNHMKTP